MKKSTTTENKHSLEYVLGVQPRQPHALRHLALRRTVRIPVVAPGFRAAEVQRLLPRPLRVRRPLRLPEVARHVGDVPVGRQQAGPVEGQVGGGGAAGRAAGERGHRRQRRHGRDALDGRHAAGGVPVVVVVVVEEAGRGGRRREGGGNLVVAVAVGRVRI